MMRASWVNGTFSDYRRTINLLVGHALITQASVSCPFPGHSPPYCGAGLSHSRVLTLVPGPQVALHTVHSSHLPHFPSTERYFNDYGGVIPEGMPLDVIALLSHYRFQVSCNLKMSS